MASWDVFHADRLELERSLSTAAVRAALARGEFRDDDLVRPAGTTVAWRRLAEQPELIAPHNDDPSTPPTTLQTGRPPASTTSGPDRTHPGAPDASHARAGPGEASDPTDERGVRRAAGPSRPLSGPERHPGEADDGDGDGDASFPDTAAGAPPPRHSTPRAEAATAPAWDWTDEDDGHESGDDEFDHPSEVPADDASVELERLDSAELEMPAGSSPKSSSGSISSHVALPSVPSRDWDADRPAVDTETDDPAEFTLARSGPMTVEELDLAPMVDVAFQLVLFFMVTATTVLFKTLEIPKPTADPPPGAVAQGHSRTLDDFQNDYVLVEIDATGAIKIDHEPVAAERATLVERMRTAREKTGRKAMLLSADYATPHRNAVLAYDAANEIGMGIAIARPTAPQGPGPGLFTGPAPGRPDPVRPVRAAIPAGGPVRARKAPPRPEPVHLPPPPAPAATPF